MPGSTPRASSPVNSSSSCRNEARGILEPELLLDALGAFQRRRGGRIDLEVIGDAFVDALELTSRQADHPVPARPLTRLENGERREDPDEADVETREQAGIVVLRRSFHDLVDDHV